MSSIYPTSGNSIAQRCQRCGVPLNPGNDGYCGNCGMRNAPPTVSTTNATGQMPFPSNPAWGGSPAQGFGQPGQTGTSGQFGQPGQFGGQQWGSVTPTGALGNPATQQPFGGQQPFSNQPSNSQPFGGQPSSTQQPFGPVSLPVQQPFGNSSSFGSTSFPQQPFNNQQSFGSVASSQAPFGNQPGNQQPFGPSSGNLPPFGTQGQFSNLNSFAGLQPNTANSPFAPQQQQPFSAPTWQGNGFQQGGANAADPDDYEPPDKGRKPKTGLILGSIILILLLLGGGVGGYLYVQRHNTTSTTPTTQVTPTATPKGPLLFHDAFQNNSNNWDLTSKPGQFSAKVGSGSLVLEDDNNKLLWELIPGGKTFNNFLLNFDATLSKGTQDNGYGVYIRGASNQSVDVATYYRFELYGDGTFAVFKGSLDSTGATQSSILVNYTVSPAIMKQGSVNHVSILANGPTLSLTVNGQLLKTFTDNSYTSGSIAFFISNLANTTPGAQATFANLAIYPPQ